MAVDVKKQIHYWLTTAESDFETAHVIFRAGKNFHHSCFFCHLVLEKALKALIVKRTKRTPLHTHDLVLLATKVALDIDDETKAFFELMN